MNKGYYVKNEVLYNNLNRPAAKDICITLGHPYSIDQQNAYELYVDQVCADYKNARKNLTQEQRQEENYERQAAFGKGQIVRDIITGETFQT